MSTIEIREEISIAKDPATIWKVLIDINSWRLWSGVIDRAVIYGRPRPGTVFKCLADTWDFDCLIKDAVPGERFSGTAKTVGIEVTFSWQITGVINGAKIEFVAAIDGWLARLFGARIKRGFEGAMFTWLLALKNFAERGVAKGTEEKKDGASGRLRKKRISFNRPLFGLLQPGRRDRDDDE